MHGQTHIKLLIIFRRQEEQNMNFSTVLRAEWLQVW